jgi:ATP-binding cassette subfamily B protein
MIGSSRFAMKFNSYRDTFLFAARYWLLSPRLFSLMIVARIASNLVDIFVPLASGALVDTLASGAGDLNAALRALAHLIGLVVAFHALRTIVAWALIYVSSRAMEALVRDAFARVQRFSSDWHANSSAGATVRKITRGMWSFDQLSDTLLFGIFPAAVVVIGATTLLVSRWPLLGGVVAIGIAIYLSISVSLSIYWIAPAGQAQQLLDSALGARLADSLTGNQVVKDFAAEGREDAAFAGLTREWRQAARLNWNRDNATGFLQSLTLIAMQAALLGSGLFLWSRGGLSTGDVVSVIGFQGLLNAYLRDFGQHVRNVQKAVNEMEDVVGFDSRAPDIVEAPNARSLRVAAGKIVFAEVSFSYPTSQRPLYEKLNLTIRAGERVGLVGASGAGKTTLVKLLQRYYDLDSGRILVDGQDIAHVTLASLRRAIGVVAQEPMLFHRPLGENIAFGRPEGRPSEIEQAARRAHADVFIDRLSGGYGTLVGERGVKLSGGERQRVAIARAILANSPILVLDEATSSLDSVSEHHIRAAIEELSYGRTTLVVAHRLSTVRQLDRILVFAHGRIIEDGPHKELLSLQNGIYRRLFETQAGVADTIDERIEALTQTGETEEETQ